MVPRTRSSAKIKFPAMYVENDLDISTKTLKDFLTLANKEEDTKDSVVLVEKLDFSSLVSDPDLVTSVQRFKGNNYYALAVEELLHEATSHPGLSKKCIVILDRITAEKNQTCMIAADPRHWINAEKHETIASFVRIRCEIADVSAALWALENDELSIQQFANDAAVASGIWSKASMDMLRARKSGIDVADYPVHSGWRQSPIGRERHQYPVFRTAHIEVNVLNEIVEEACDNAVVDGFAFSFITALQAPYYDGPTTSPLSVCPALPDHLLNATPEECDAIVRSRFPGQDAGPDLNFNRYIIMDEVTARSRSVILAFNCEQDRLKLVRCVPKDIFSQLCCPGYTSINVDMIVDKAMLDGTGVAHE